MKNLVTESSPGHKRWDLVIKIALLMKDSVSIQGFRIKVL